MMLAVFGLAAVCLLGYLCLMQAHHILRCIYDLDELKQLRPKVDAEARQPHAIVVGASWTGMLAAATLAPYFHRVTVLERDSQGELHLPTARRGVPHGTQSHVIGRYAIEFVNAALPSFERALRDAGGRTGGDMGIDFGWFHRGRWRLQQPLGLPMWFASRPLVERTLRQTVLQQHPNITLESGVRVNGLVMHGRQVRGVACSQRSADRRQVLADLVVDCTGKHSQIGRWLAAAGVGPVRERVVNSATFYATRRFVRHPEGRGRDWAMTWHGDHRTARGGHFAGAITVEHDHVWVWAVQTGAALRARGAAFSAFFDNMGTGALADLVHSSHADAPVPQGEACSFGAGASRRRLFTRVRPCMPDALVVLGDAACCTNPAFGLGLWLSASTVACLAAALHRRWRRAWLKDPKTLRGLGPEVAHRVAWRTLGPWLLTTAEDYRLPHTEGPHRGHALVRALQWYVDRAFTQAHAHPFIDALVLRVVSGMAHPLRVFSPRLVWQVVMHSLQRSTFAKVTYERTH